VLSMAMHYRKCDQGPVWMHVHFYLARIFTWPFGYSDLFGTVDSGQSLKNLSFYPTHTLYDVNL